jgi:hypothetical protein
VGHTAFVIASEAQKAATNYVNKRVGLWSNKALFIKTGWLWAMGHGLLTALD